MTASLESEPSVAQLFGALARGTGLLARQEVQLATSELAEKTARTGRAVGVIAAGGALVHAGLLGLMVALAIVLASSIPLWAAAFVVGSGVLLIGCGVLGLGLKTLRHVDVALARTAQTLLDDKRWAEEKLR
jgi:uncharacterized membrane protein YqjE